jgi:hypothetical protein
LAGETAAQFQKRFVDRLRPQFRWTGLVNVLFDTPRLHGFSIKLATALPSLVTWLAQSTRLRGFERLSMDPEKRVRPKAGPSG